MKKIIPITLFICLIISLFSTLSISKSVKELQKKNLELKSELDNYNYGEERDKKRYSLNIFSENKPISDLSLLINKTDSISLSSIVNGPKLIYRFYENTCVQCMEDELDIVKNLADSIGEGNILILSDFEDFNRVKAIINRKRIKSPFYFYTKRFDLPIENKDEQDVASFFILNKNLITQFVYKAGGDQDINDPYYKRIIDFFNDGF